MLAVTPGVRLECGPRTLEHLHYLTPEHFLAYRYDNEPDVFHDFRPNREFICD
jgi:hypothetical protein